jgi:hypothetical protein
MVSVLKLATDSLRVGPWIVFDFRFPGLSTHSTGSFSFSAAHTLDFNL